MNIRLAVIGSGQWGINHIKTAHALLGDDFIVGDTSALAEAKVRTVSLGIQFTTKIESILHDPAINAVIVATPAETHYELTKKALNAGKHVLVEKPITLHTRHAEELVSIASSGNKILMVGHVLLYHPALVKVKELIDTGMVGRLQYIYSNRLNLGTVRSEENVLWSFAPHDISIIQHLVGKTPLDVEAHGSVMLQHNIEDTTITYLTYPDNVRAHIFVSWLNPFKEQKLVVIGEKGMFVFEDSIKTDKLKFFPKGFTVDGGKVSKFDGEYQSIPFIDAQPLAEEHKHFYKCIAEGTEPLTNGVHALEVLRILEQAQERLKNYGRKYILYR